MTTKEKIEKIEKILQSPRTTDLMKKSLEKNLKVLKAELSSEKKVIVPKKKVVVPKKEVDVPKVSKAKSFPKEVSERAKLIYDRQSEKNVSDQLTLYKNEMGYNVSISEIIMAYLPEGKFSDGSEKYSLDQIKSMVLNVFDEKIPNKMYHNKNDYEKDLFEKGDVVRTTGLPEVVNGKKNPLYNLKGVVRNVQHNDIDVNFDSPKFLGSEGFLPKNLVIITKAKDVKPPAPKKYKLGDLWSSDFDYDGMLDIAARVGVDGYNLSVSDLDKLKLSLDDVNYHTISKAVSALIVQKKVTNYDNFDLLKLYYKAVKDAVDAEKKEDNSDDDLFEATYLLPKKVQDIVSDFIESDITYESCKGFVKDLQKEGYTCEYGLDAEPYGLRKMTNLEKEEKAPIEKSNLEQAAKSDQLDPKIAECKKALEDAKYSVTKKRTAQGTKVIKTIRQDRTILKDKMESVFKTIQKDVPKENKDIVAKLSIIAEKLKGIIQSIDKLVQANDIEKLNKIEAMLKSL